MPTRNNPRSRNSIGTNRHVAPAFATRWAARIKMAAAIPLAAKQVQYISRSNVLGMPLLAKIAITTAMQLTNANISPKIIPYMSVVMPTPGRFLDLCLVGQPFQIFLRSRVYRQHQKLWHIIAVQSRDRFLQLLQSPSSSLDDQQKLPRLFDFSLPSINRLHRGGNHIHASRQPLRHHRPSNLPPLRQAPTRNHHHPRIRHTSHRKSPVAAAFRGGRLFPCWLFPARYSLPATPYSHSTPTELH